MDAPQQPSRNTEANIRKATDAIAEVLEMKQEFIRCHDSLANRTYRLATCAQPDDATVRKAITKNEQRVLAVYLHVRSGYRGIDVARFFKVPKTTVEPAESQSASP